VIFADDERETVVERGEPDAGRQRRDFVRGGIGCHEKEIERERYSGIAGEQFNSEARIERIRRFRR
jgi:hypothetical protein